MIKRIVGRRGVRIDGAWYWADGFQCSIGCRVLLMRINGGWAASVGGTRLVLSQSDQ